MDPRKFAREALRKGKNPAEVKYMLVEKGFSYADASNIVNECMLLKNQLQDYGRKFMPVAIIVLVAALGIVAYTYLLPQMAGLNPMQNQPESEYPYYEQQGQPTDTSQPTGTTYTEAPTLPTTIQDTEPPMVVIIGAGEESWNEERFELNYHIMDDSLVEQCILYFQTEPGGDWVEQENVPCENDNYIFIETSEFSEECKAETGICGLQIIAHDSAGNVGESKYAYGS